MDYRRQPITSENKEKLIALLKSEQFKEGQITQKDLARRFGVHTATITKVRRELEIMVAGSQWDDGRKV
jgi:hypothetical protein